MRRTSRTKAKIKARSPENEMMGLGLFGSSSPASSSSSSSNLSPLALPFTLGSSNHNKFNLGSNPDSHFNFNSPNFQSSTTSQGLLADSIRTATVPSTYSTFSDPNPNPKPITTPTTHNRPLIPDVYSSAIGPNPSVIDASFSTFSSPINTQSIHNWSSMNSSVKSGLEPVNQPAVNLSAMNPNPQLIDASFSTFPNPINTPRTHNWSSMNSTIKSGLEPHTWSLGHDDRDDDAPMMALNFNLLQDFGSSQDSFNRSLFGSKYSGQVDGSRGKQDSSMFGGVFGSHVTRENNSGPSVIGNSHSTSLSATGHGIVSSGISNEHTFPWNDSTSQYLFETRSVVYDSSSDHISPSIATKSLDISSTSLLNKNNLSGSHNSLKEKQSYQPVGTFDYRSSLNIQAPDIKSTEEVNSGAPLSDHLDHHNPGEDSPCWKGAPTHFSSSGSQEQESAQHPMKKLQKKSGDDVPLHMDLSFQGTVENDANVESAESLDVNMIVKAMNNLSELLVLHYSKDECGLKEQDHKALDHVIANLNLCIFRKREQVDLENDQFDKNIKELQGGYVRDEYIPKDYKMVQKIKRVLDEDLECMGDLQPDPMLYKNLWLDAEAELCVSSYRARLHRAKREIGKAKPLGVSGVASDIKKISISNLTPTVSEPLHEAAGSNTSSKHAPNLSLPTGNTDDVEDSVMARFNILKRREVSCIVNMAEKEPTDVELERSSGNEIQSSGVAEELHLQHHHDTDNAVVMPCHTNHKDVDNAVMARWNILRSRGEQRPSVDAAHAQVSEEGMEMGTSMMQNQFGSPTASSFGWEYVDNHE